MRVVVDANKCVASGQCVLIAEDVFDQDDELGTVLLRESRPAAHLDTKVRDAADSCPAQAIAVSAD